MIIGILQASLYLSEPQSLKDKRRILKSLIERMKNKFNASVAEIDQLDSWNYAKIGVVCVSNDAGHADSMMSSVINFIEAQTQVELTHVETEHMRV